MSFFGKLKAAWLIVSGDNGALTDLVCRFLNKLLAKIKDPDKAREIADVVAKVAAVLKTACDLVKSDKLKAALVATVKVVEDLARAVEDCKISVDEVDGLAQDVADAVKAWKAA